MRDKSCTGVLACLRTCGFAAGLLLSGHAQGAEPRASAYADVLQSPVAIASSGNIYPSVELPAGASDPAAPLVLRLTRSLDLQELPLQQTHTVGGIFMFLYWFAVLMLACLVGRDTLRLFSRLLPAAPRPRRGMPFACWPRVTLVVESVDARRMGDTLTAVSRLDYPADFLHVIALGNVHDGEIRAVIAQAAALMPGRLVPLQTDTEGDVAQRCFAAGLRYGNDDIIIVIADDQPVSRDTIKVCVEPFFDPALGALLGFLPDGAFTPTALAARLAEMQRSASQITGFALAHPLVPGTGLLAVRRAAVQAAGGEAALADGCFPLLHRLEHAGNALRLLAEQTAAGEPVHDWRSRAAWVAERSRARVTAWRNAPLSRFINAAPGDSDAMLPGMLQATLWCVVAVAALVLYFRGEALPAAIGLALCTATAFGLDGTPAPLVNIAVLFRVHGRHPEARLAALAPVVFLHDVFVALIGSVLEFPRLVRRRKRISALNGDTLATEASTLS